MSDLIERLAKDFDEQHTIYKDNNKIVFSIEDLKLSVYDKENIMGFTLEGSANGRDVYVVHDTDNYDRKNPEYKYIYDEAAIDSRHIVSMFLKHRIKTKLTTEKKFLREKKVLQIIIPDQEGRDHIYQNPAINITSFYKASDD